MAAWLEEIVSEDQLLLPGHAACAAFSASSDFSSPATLSAYPDFASTVVVPCAAISRKLESTNSTSLARAARRTPAMLEAMPPPATAISS